MTTFPRAPTVLKGAIVGIDHFGASAPGKTVLEQFGFTPENVARRAEAVVNRLKA